MKILSLEKKNLTLSFFLNQGNKANVYAHSKQFLPFLQYKKKELIKKIHMSWIYT